MVLKMDFFIQLSGLSSQVVIRYLHYSEKEKRNMATVKESNHHLSSCCSHPTLERLTIRPPVSLKPPQWCLISHELARGLNFVTRAQRTCEMSDEKMK